MSEVHADLAGTGTLAPDSGALSGMLVLDFGQAAVGPVAASYLPFIPAGSPASSIARSTSAVQAERLPSW